MRIGFHIAIAGGWEKALQRAIEWRCTTMQVFTSAPVQWAHSELDVERAGRFGEALGKLDIQPLFVHGSYLVNLASANDEIREKSCANLAQELGRAEVVGARGVIVHPGNAGEGEPAEKGLKRTADGIDEVLGQVDNGVELLLENTAGQGNAIGTTPGQLSAIIERTEHRDRIGVCLDTAHAFARGHPIHTVDGLTEFLGECDRGFGLERVRVIHASDSRTALGSRVDRHWHIGRGEIGMDGFRAIMNHALLQELPFILETPEQDEWHRRDWLAIRRALDGANRPPLPPRKREVPLILTDS